MTAHCLRRTSIFVFIVIKSDVIILITVHFKNPFYVLEIISDGMFLWNVNQLWCHLCVLFKYVWCYQSTKYSIVSKLQETVFKMSWNMFRRKLFIFVLLKTIFLFLMVIFLYRDYWIWIINSLFFLEWFFILKKWFWPSCPKIRSLELFFFQCWRCLLPKKYDFMWLNGQNVCWKK